jgi:hypothetical protein
MATTPKTDKQAPVPVPADLFAAGNGRATVALAGLLADKPELREQQMLPEQWQDALDAYLASERP